VRILLVQTTAGAVRDAVASTREVATHSRSSVPAQAAGNFLDTLDSGLAAANHRTLPAREESGSAQRIESNGL
jgi:hypothetical protein